MAPKLLFLRLAAGREIPLGAVSEPADVPELLRHVADFYDSNPGELDALLSAAGFCSAPSYVADPFGAGSVRRGGWSAA